MNAFTPFRRPKKVSRHCRHYDYVIDTAELSKMGPHCAKKVDVGRTVDIKRCMPDPTGEGCPLREEYTEAEHAAWDAYRAAAQSRMERAIAALPSPLLIGSTGTISCPNCSGVIRYSRLRSSASLACSTENCVQVFIDTAPGADWPTGGSNDG